MKSVVGIYVGLFDPVHAGHIAFALQAIAETSLESVYFLPERVPTHTKPIEHYGHRVAMLERALAPHQQLGVVETADKRFVPTQTIPRLQSVLGSNQLAFLCDTQAFIRLIETARKPQNMYTYIVQVRANQEIQSVTKAMELYDVSPKNVTLFDAIRPDVATEYIRLALNYHKNAPGLLPSVVQYARSEWLYVDVQRS